MTVITIDGQIGAGAPEVGRQVAATLNIDYYDRLLLQGVAEKVGATVAAVLDKERAGSTWSDRFRAIADRAINSLALTAGAGDPYFGGILSEAMPLTWDESGSGPRTRAHQIGKSEFAKATAEHIREIAETGNAVIVHRAGCVELKDRPNTFRVGLFAPLRDRVWRMMTREGFLRPEDAEAAIAERERSQLQYFRSVHDVHPHDEEIYDLNVSTSTSDLDLVALKVVHALRGRHDITGVALA
jgi:cytidylate kinase